MTDLETQIAHDVRSLMNAISELTKVALDPAYAVLIARETNDIELAYTQLGRLVNRVRTAERLSMSMSLVAAE